MRATLIGSFIAFALPSMVQAMPEPQPLASMASAIYVAADADGDGLVTRAELDGALAALEARTPMDFERDWATMLRVAGIDAKADRVDYPAAVRGALALYGHADANGDDRVTADEMRAFAATLPEDDRDAALEMMATGDADTDGVVDSSEMASVRKDLENYLATQAVDPDSVPEDSHVLKSETLAGFVERARAVRWDVVGRFERVSANGGSAQVSLLQADANRVAGAIAPELR